MPLLLEAMGELSKQKYFLHFLTYGSHDIRPENPIEFVAQYLLKHNPERKIAEEVK